MRLPSAPAPVLSPSGHYAAVIQDDVVAIVKTATGRRTDVALPAEAHAAAFAPDDGHIALSAGSEVGLLSLHAPKWPEAGATEPAGSVFRLALGKGYLVAVLRNGARTMRLCAWRVEDDGLIPLGDPAGLDMGALAVYHLHVDEARGRILVAGLTGAQALAGDGKPFTGIFGLATDFPLLWKGEGLPFRPHGYLYPLADGVLGITNRDTLAVVSLDALPQAKVMHTTVWPTPLERTALSPDGRRLAWMWAGDENEMSLNVGTPSDPAPAEEAHFTLDGNFPALAVDNAGLATLVAGARPDQMLIVSAAPGRDVETQSVTVPAEPDM